MNRSASPHIRYATAEDASQLADFGATTFSAAFAAENTPEDMATYLAASFNPTVQAREIADPDTIVLIAEIDEALAGYVKLQLGDAPSCVTGPKPIELSRLYVSNTLIGSGVGAALMQGCIDTSRRAGCRTLWLGVWEKNQRAVGFYRKWEFQVVGDKNFVLGTDAQRDLVMVRGI